MAQTRRSGAEREALRRQRARKTQPESAEAPSPSSSEPVESMDEMYERLRSGAANVAGVTYQINLATLLLVSGRSAAPTLPNVALVRPEGFEDIDCQLDDGRWLLVQSKQRSSGVMSRAKIAAAIVHAGQVESARDYDGAVDGYAIVCNRGFAIGATGWTSTLAGDDVELTETVSAQLTEASRDPAFARDLIGRRNWSSQERPFVTHRMTATGEGTSYGSAA